MARRVLPAGSQSPARGWESTREDLPVARSATGKWWWAPGSLHRAIYNYTATRRDIKSFSWYRPSPPSAGFASAPAPRRGMPISGSRLLGSPIPNGSPLSDALSLSSPPAPGAGSLAMSSPQRSRPPLPPSVQHPHLQQQQQQHSAPPGALMERQSSSSSGNGNKDSGAGSTLEGAIAALEAASLQDSQVSEAGPPGPAAAGPSSEAAARGEGAQEEGGASSSSGNGGDRRAWERRQLGGSRRQSPSARLRGRKGMFGESYPSPWRDPRYALDEHQLLAVSAASRCASECFAFQLDTPYFHLPHPAGSLSLPAATAAPASTCGVSAARWRMRRQALT